MSDDMGDEMGDDMSDGTGPGASAERSPSCGAVEDDLVEMALGSLSGKRRVAVLAHLESCSQCAREVEELSAAADQLLHLAPSVEPPVGFEARVFERLGLRQAQTRPRAWSVWSRKPAFAIVTGIAAAVFALGLVVGHGALTNNPKSVSVGNPLQEASLVSGGRSVGKVMVYAGNPTWLFMYVDDSRWHGALHCQVVVDRGATINLGEFWLSNGGAAWAASVDQPAGRLREARLVGSTGAVLAVATLP